MEITRKNAIELKCWECMGSYVDGKSDCKITSCPLYSYMPYRECEPNFSLIKFDPKRCGKILKKKRIVSEEEKIMLKNRLEKNRENLPE